MPNYNRNYSPSEFDSLLKKYAELAEIRAEVELLTGETTHVGIIKEIRRRRDREKTTACPPHMYLGLTPNKQQVVKESWEREVSKLANSDMREESLLYLVTQMSEKENIEQVREYVKEKRKYVLDSKEEKTFQKRFN